MPPKPIEIVHMLPFTTGCYHWAKKVIRSVLPGVLEVFASRSVNTALVIAAGEMGTT